MKKKDVEKKIISTLEDISAPLNLHVLDAIKQGMRDKKVRKPNTIIKFAIAACMSVVVCLAIILPIVLKPSSDSTKIEAPPYKTLYVYGYKSASVMAMTDASGIVSIEKIEDMIEIELNTWYFTSGVPNNAITVKYSDTEETDVVFLCTTSKGKFWWNNNQYVESATIKPGETLYWHNTFDSEQGKYDVEQGEKVYIDISLSVSNKIIGYAVIEVESLDELNFTPLLKKATVFPKVDGNYQDITEDYMTKIFENIRKG